MRKKTKKIRLGNLYIGGDAPITVQSMTNTNTNDIKKTLAQIKELTSAGCEIIRVSAPNRKSASCLKDIKQEIEIPIIADIHFDYKIAIEAIKSGVDGLRINPGNIGEVDRIKKVVYMAKDYNIPIRIGVNAGSLEKDILNKYKVSSPKAMLESAMRHIKILENLEFYNIKVSMKASNIKKTIEAYRLLSKEVSYPLHVGITEAGTEFNGTIKSAMGIGILLFEGIGDTIRVSLTSNPVKEVKAGIAILKNLGIRKSGVEFISCPSCARVSSDHIELAQKIETLSSSIQENIKIAVMGCMVNGPGEAKEADWAIVSAGKQNVQIYKKGKLLELCPKNIILKRFSELLSINKDFLYNK